MKEVVIDIDEQGNVQVEGNGFIGQECGTLTAAIEQALGEVERKRLKPEYRQARPIMRKAGA